jgi:hypothetical protein
LWYGTVQVTIGSLPCASARCPGRASPVRDDALARRAVEIDTARALLERRELATLSGSTEFA